MDTCPLCDSDNITHIKTMWQCYSCRSLFNDNFDGKLFEQDGDRITFHAPFLTGRGFGAIDYYISAHPECPRILSESAVYNHAARKGFALVSRTQSVMIFSSTHYIDNDLDLSSAAEFSDIKFPTIEEDINEESK